MLLSEKLGIKKDTKLNMELFHKLMRNPYSISKSEEEEYMDLAFRMFTLGKYATIDDQVALDYLGQHYLYYCQHFSWTELSVSERNSFIGAGKYGEGFSKLALERALENCPSEFAHDFEAVIGRLNDDKSVI